MDASRREEILRAYVRRAKGFEEIATRSHHPIGLFRGSEPVAEAPEARPGPQPNRLSGRQQEVLLLVAAGLSNHEIGKRLQVSEETIKTHIRHVLHELGARNRAHAVFIASGQGLLG